jgi:isovaleryl-CoA dehydrogenase
MPSERHDTTKRTQFMLGQGMTGFELDEQQQAILDLADRFGRERLHGLAPRMDAEEWWPAEAFPAFGEAGLLGITIDEEYGGAGLDLLAAGLVLQGFARWNHALALSWVAHDNLCANNIFRNGTAEQRRKYLPDLCAGRTIGCLGLTEPGAGSDALGAMRTTAHRDGDHYVLNGSKIYITNGAVADVVLVYAKTDRDRGAKGISAFIVETTSPGFAVAQKLNGLSGADVEELTKNSNGVPSAVSTSDSALPLDSCTQTSSSGV